MVDVVVGQQEVIQILVPGGLQEVFCVGRIYLEGADAGVGLLVHGLGRGRVVFAGVYHQ